MGGSSTHSQPEQQMPLHLITHSSHSSKKTHTHTHAQILEAAQVLLVYILL